MAENMNEQYVNRELSWLMFNNRVLEEAYDKKSRIFTRLKFLAITASNLDEFFMVRVAGIKQQLAAKYNKRDIAGMTPKEQLEAIYEETQKMMKKMYNCLNKSILPKLEQEGIFMKKYSDLNPSQKEYADEFFEEFCLPVLTPLAVDSGRPFPHLGNKSLNIAVELDFEDDDKLYAVVQVPSVLTRFVEVDADGDETVFVYLEDIIENNLDKLFKGYEISGTVIFRITRDADLAIDEDEAEDLLLEIEKYVKKRKWGSAVRLELQKKGDKGLMKFMKKNYGVSSDEIYELTAPLDLASWFSFIGNSRFSHLIDEDPKPQRAMDFYGEEDIFSAIRERDRMIHLPYESFDKVLEFIDRAVDDPDVLAIKQTLYRVSKNSPIIDKLIRAAENGKQVTVVVELKARFDEENNIVWAKKLERAGCHVVYGLPGLKIHCKALLVVRREDEGINRYVHMATGNYNDSTAKLYEDIGMFTCREDICSDISNMFNTITGYTKHREYKKIFVAPHGMRKGFEHYIDREIWNVKNGGYGRIIAKFNSLVDKKIINKLYEASREGVEIDLIIRGVCCLRAGVPGLSENIRVRSIIGTFLEHSRIYYFYNEGYSDIFLSSADWMERNLDRRIEVLFPVENGILKERVVEMLELSLADTEKSRFQLEDGSYRRVDKRGKESVNVQMRLHENAVENFRRAKEEMMGV
ncbi:polyphosphate kinase [Dethiosulfatibacter aminovorans DSM 17477]|uniref:Polyphosphate kinase n=1 Tax=Dethiosulfatibacter aminovorans DSM 17477 TaxID=1121476 RepID=A0A1M6IN58_9FIRM|nr:RNA degradosome polyphosphate kinase [Dethiosulfatibacter aminovorans]SHJ35885.1 polyphosphate kinase [Dethiosulfatibacter aminovorans DSM 17477]